MRERWWKLKLLVQNPHVVGECILIKEATSKEWITFLDTIKANDLEYKLIANKYCSYFN